MRYPDLELIWQNDVHKKSIAGFELTSLGTVRFRLPWSGICF
jgi:hypothetical protein